jgi:hypothetical protein
LLAGMPLLAAPSPVELMQRTLAGVDAHAQQRAPPSGCRQNSKTSVCRRRRVTQTPEHSRPAHSMTPLN